MVVMMMGIEQNIHFRNAQLIQQQLGCPAVGHRAAVDHHGFAVQPQHKAVAHVHPAKPDFQQPFTLFFFIKRHRAKFGPALFRFYRKSTQGFIKTHLRQGAGAQQHGCQNKHQNTGNFHR